MIKKKQKTFAYCYATEHIYFTVIIVFLDFDKKVNLTHDKRGETMQ